MAQKSNIEWTDHTWNIARGCTKVDADCTFCYMYRDSMARTRYNPNRVIRTKTVFNLPLKIKEPSRIFTSSLTDFFHEDIDPYRWEAFDIIRRCPQHTFQILTKRPERVMECIRMALNQIVDQKLDRLETAVWLSNWHDGGSPKNVWLGTSVGSQKGMSRIYELGKIPAKVRFVSLEPLFEFVDLESNVFPDRITMHVSPDARTRYIDLLDWVIVGGESGNDTGKYRYRSCHLTWLKEIVRTCQWAQVPIFVKQLGTHLAKGLHLKDRHGRNMDEWPEMLDHLKVRQFPQPHLTPARS